jgi:ribonuclease T2
MNGTNTAHARYRRESTLILFAGRARKLQFPEQYSQPTVALVVTPNQVVDAFINANDGLSPEGITVGCDRKRLREVRICFTRDLKFRDCSPSVQGACHSEKLIMPPVRGG